MSDIQYRNLGRNGGRDFGNNLGIQQRHGRRHISLRMGLGRIQHQSVNYRLDRQFSQRQCVFLPKRVGDKLRRHIYAKRLCRLGNRNR